MTEFIGGTTIDQWSKFSAAIGNKELAAKLYDDKLAGINALNILGLPVPKGEMVSATQYLEDPLNYLDKLETDLVYINIIPTSKDQKKYTRFGITKEDAIQFIESRLPIEQAEQYFVGVYEYHQNVYGGSVIINPNGHILMEFGKGSCSDYTRGSSIPQFSAERDIYTGVIHYNTENVELRVAAWQTLQCIPNDGEGINVTFLPGYYEFSLYRDIKNDNLVPIFFDYKDNPVYQLINISV